jgi:DNA (cytosine-5)-methyltransferase 1
MPAHPIGGNAASFWPTPRARDWKGGAATQRNRRRACPLNDAVGGCLNPDWVEWLMGFPPGWTAAPG